VIGQVTRGRKKKGKVIREDGTIESDAEISKNAFLGC
jgi:hypothetical protein